MQWRHHEWRYRHLDIAQFPNDRLELVVIDTVEGLDYHQVVVLLLVFIDGRLHWSEVFLVAQIDMVE